MKFSKHQPKNGETVVGCAHLLDENAKPFHFFQALPEATFTRPNGTKGRTQWIVICDACNRTHPTNPEAVVTRDFEWIGNEPVVMDLSN